MEKPFYSDSEGESGPTESADSGNFRGLVAVTVHSHPLVKRVHHRCVCVCEHEIFAETQCEKLRHNKCSFRNKATIIQCRSYCQQTL